MIIIFWNVCFVIIDEMSLIDCSLLKKVDLRSSRKNDLEDNKGTNCSRVKVFCCVQFRGSSKRDQLCLSATVNETDFERESRLTKFYGFRPYYRLLNSWDKKGRFFLKNKEKQLLFAWQSKQMSCTWTIRQCWLISRPQSCSKTTTAHSFSVQNGKLSYLLKSLYTSRVFFDRIELRSSWSRTKWI